MIKILKLFSYSYLLFAICYFCLSGCVTVPLEEALPSYDIDGITYLPLVSLCNLKGINLEYDTFSRSATLTKDAHKINLMAGERTVLVDGSPKYLKHPVDIYQGTMVVPYKFKEQILDALFKEFKAAAPLIKIKKVVIDAGHGGGDPGAIGRMGLREKDINLDIAKRVSRILRDEGVEVVMVRSSDKFISLSRRVDIANNSGADIFLSIHANANRVRSLRGFEVYYISANVNDAQRALSTAKNAGLNLEEATFASNSLDLKATLWDMIYTYNRSQSIELARSICRTIDRDLDTRILGIKGASFYVLKGIRIPAILIEVGFLSNYHEERFLRNSYYRQRIAESINQGILDYAQNLMLAKVKR